MDQSLRSMGKTIVWSAEFKKAMIRLATMRGLPEELPGRVGAAPLRQQGLLLLWPESDPTAGGHPVTSSPQGRRVTTDLAGPFAELGADIPEGLVAELPFTPHRSSRHGLCLALQFQRATFLYKESRGSAIGLQDEWE